MTRLWIFLTIVLDVFPYIFLQYLPFKDKLRYGYGKSIVICTAVLLVWFVPFPFLMSQPWFTLNMMLLYRVSLIVPLLLLSVFLIRKNLFQNLFVFSLMLPYVLLVITASGFLIGFIHVPTAPLYMVSSLCRIFLAAVTFPIMLWLFRRSFIPAMALQDGGIWKYAWPIPASFNFISLFFLSNDYEINGADLSQLLGYLSVMACSILTCLLVAAVLKRTQERAELMERERHSGLLLELQAQQYRDIAKRMDETTRSRHDLRHQLLLIGSFVTAENLEGLRAYLSEYERGLPLDTPVSYSENHTINVILGHYIALAKQEQIQVEVDLSLCEIAKIADSDLCVLLGNLMENAIEACRTVSGEKSIRLKSDLIAKRFSIVISNSFDGVLQTKNGRYLSRKRSFTKEGIGLATVEAVVQKYGGQLRVEQEDGRFLVSLFLQVK